MAIKGNEKQDVCVLLTLELTVIDILTIDKAPHQQRGEGATSAASRQDAPGLSIWLVGEEHFSRCFFRDQKTHILR